MLLFVCTCFPQGFNDKEHTFFISNTFISSTRLKVVKHEPNAKQHAEAELLLFES